MIIKFFKKILDLEVDDIQGGQYIHFNSRSYLGTQVRIWNEDKPKTKSLTITANGKNTKIKSCRKFFTNSHISFLAIKFTIEEVLDSIEEIVNPPFLIKLDAWFISIGGHDEKNESRRLVYPNSG